VVRDTFTTPEDLAYKAASALGRHLLRQQVKSGIVQAAEKRSAAINERVLDRVARRAERLEPIIRGARILLVNDIPREMRFMVEMLEQLQIEVEIATNSERAIELLAATPFDAVLSDMARDGVADEGIRFLAQLRKRGAHPPVIFTVGRYQPERGTPAYAFGITNRVDDMVNLLFDIFERVRG